MPEIRISADASQAIGELKSLNNTANETNDTLGSLTKKLSEAQQAGNYRQAAQITHQIDNARSVKPDTSNMQSSAVSGNTATLTQALSEAQQAGNYRQAAQITHQIDNARSVKPDTSNMQSSAVSGNTATLTQALSEAQQAGNYRQAAQITHQIDNARRLKPDTPELQRTHVPSYSGTNAHKLDTRLEILTKTIDELTHQLEEATEKGQSREAYNISSALNNVEQERQRLEQEKKLNEQKKDKDDPADVIKRYGLSKYFTQGLGYAQQIAGIGFNRRTAMANGDYLGADVGVLEGRSNIAQNLGGSVLGAGMTLGATPAGVPLMLTGGVLSILGTIGNIIAGDKRADIAEGSAYERSLTHTGALNRRYAQGGTWEDNASRTSELLEKAAKYAEGTNMSAYDIVDIATQMSQYGAGTSDLALKQASDVAARVNATGVDAATVQNFLGTAYRYGDRGDVLGYASQARQAAGMTKAQDKEFLIALQSVIEEGIAGGYVKSVEDVSKTMTMFARLSDNNPLWQGAQGASRLRQMDSSIAGATGLQNTSDMIIATAANGILDGKNIAQRNKLIDGGATGTYVDTMLLMEQGNNPEMFAQIAKSVQDLEGEGNIAGQIERFKDIFKLNYHGGRDVYNMVQKLNSGEISTDDFQKKIESMKKDEKYQSDDTKRQNAITNIEASVALMAKSKFWEGTEYLSNMSVEKEYDLLKAEMGTAGFSFYKHFITEKGGNEDLNKVANKMVEKYAKYGERKPFTNGWNDFFGYKADKEATYDEKEMAAKEMDKNIALKLSYEKGDKESFLALLEQLLIKVFGTINATLIEP